MRDKGRAAEAHPGDYQGAEAEIDWLNESARLEHGRKFANRLVPSLVRQDWHRDGAWGNGPIAGSDKESLDRWVDNVRRRHGKPLAEKLALILRVRGGIEVIECSPRRSEREKILNERERSLKKVTGRLVDALKSSLQTAPKFPVRIDDEEGVTRKRVSFLDTYVVLAKFWQERLQSGWDFSSRDWTVDSRIAAALLTYEPSEFPQAGDELARKRIEEFGISADAISVAILAGAQFREDPIEFLKGLNAGMKVYANGSFVSESNGSGTGEAFAERLEEFAGDFLAAYEAYGIALSAQMALSGCDEIQPDGTVHHVDGLEDRYGVRGSKKLADNISRLRKLEELLPSHSQSRLTLTSDMRIPQPQFNRGDKIVRWVLDDEPKPQGKPRFRDFFAGYLNEMPFMEDMVRSVWTYSQLEQSRRSREATVTGLDAR